ncbi:MAG: HAD-IIIA family hydrolase [Verrucomicrobiaceae bacterium]|nr:HAD-IIIA family hydrolase [Verrucomicrobiaceae bacterium]
MPTRTAITQAVILCGGKGTRLGPLTQSCPKPMLPLAGRPLLDHTLEFLAAHGVRHAILAAGHQSEVIADHYATGSASGITIHVHQESTPLGTAGALREFAAHLHERFFVIYGDVFLDFDLTALGLAHCASSATGTLLVRASDHPWDSDLVEMDAHSRISGFVTRRESGRLYRNVANAAVYALESSLIDAIPAGRASDFVHDVFPTALTAGAELRGHFIDPAGFVKDMGTPDRLAKVETYLTWRERSRTARVHPAPVRAVILDRDGTINVERGLLTRVEDLELLPGAAEGISSLCAAGLRCFIATNQPAIARGLLTEEGLHAIHERLCAELATAGAHIEKIYHSPFHPETHHGEGIPELRRDSDCRKPKPGMLRRAVEEQGLDLAATIMIGDSDADRLAAQAAGMRFIGVGPKWAAHPSPPAVCLPDLRAAALYLQEHGMNPNTSS